MRIRYFLSIASFSILLGHPTEADRLHSVGFHTIHHYAVGFTDTFRKLTGSDLQTNFNNRADSIALLSVGFSSLPHDPSDLTAARQDAVGTEEFRVEGKPLVYPNPFRQNVGAELGYELTDNMDIEIHLFNMLGNLITKKEFFAGSNGGRIGYNSIRFDLDTFDGYELAAGVYFFLLVRNGSVLSKGKMAVIP